MPANLEVVLVAPRIPQNVGAVARTCAAVGARLILVRPLIFSLDDRAMRRAGLDYWSHVDLEVWDHLDPLHTRADVWLFSSKAKQQIGGANLQRNATLVFGSEVDGLPPSLLDSYPMRQLRLPMVAGPRCLNLAVAASVGVYLAWQMQGFQGAEGV